MVLPASDSLDVGVRGLFQVGGRDTPRPRERDEVRDLHDPFALGPEHPSCRALGIAEEFGECLVSRFGGPGYRSS